jgi:hypothetical protein
VYNQPGKEFDAMKPTSFALTRNDLVAILIALILIIMGLLLLFRPIF